MATCVYSFSATVSNLYKGEGTLHILYIMVDSLTLSLSGTSSVLEAQYFPSIDLSRNKSYVLGLVELLSFNSIPNIDEGNNRSYVDKEIVLLPTGSYEIEDIESYLHELLSPKDILISIKPNNNTLRSEIKCTHQVDFRVQDSIGKFLGFAQRILEPNITHSSDLPVSILKINALRVECNVTDGAYINDRRVHKTPIAPNIGAILLQYCFGIFPIFANAPSTLLYMDAIMEQCCCNP